MTEVTSAALHARRHYQGKEQTMKSKAGVAERPSYQPALLFVIGLGLNSSWWLCLSANPNVWIFSNSNVSWAATAVMHLAYLATHLACVVLALPLSARLRQRPFSLALGVITAFSALAIGTLSAAQLPIPLYLACLIAGSITNAVLFLGWMALFAEALCLSLQLPAIVASMAFSSALWLITTSLPGWAMLAICAVMPIVSAGFFCALHSYSDDSNLSKTAANTGDAPERVGSVFKLLTPTFLIGIAAYELVPGFVTSIAHVNNTSGLYAFYAMEMSVVAVLCFAFGRKPGFLRVINRFVLPLLSVGLIALGLFSANQVDIALAASLSGSMLFEAFLFCRLAQLARLHRAEPPAPLRRRWSGHAGGPVHIVSSRSRAFLACSNHCRLRGAASGRPVRRRRAFLYPPGSNPAKRFGLRRRIYGWRPWRDGRRFPPHRSLRH